MPKGYTKKGGHGGAGRGQGNVFVRGALRAYGPKEDAQGRGIGKFGWQIGWRCRALRSAKPSRSRQKILEQVAEEASAYSKKRGGKKVSTARVDRCWKQVNRMLEDMRGDSPVSDYKPDTRARLSDNDYDDSSSGHQ